MKEYRVFASYRMNGRVQDTLRQEGPFSSRKEAEDFAAGFLPPKFVSTRVECRKVGRWYRILRQKP